MPHRMDDTNRIALNPMTITSVAEGEHGTIITTRFFDLRHVHIVRQSLDEVQAMLAQLRGLFPGKITLDLVQADDID